MNQPRTHTNPLRVFFLSIQSEIIPNVLYAVLISLFSLPIFIPIFCFLPSSSPRFVRVVIYMLGDECCTCARNYNRYTFSSAFRRLDVEVLLLSKKSWRRLNGITVFFSARSVLDPASGAVWNIYSARINTAQQSTAQFWCFLSPLLLDAGYSQLLGVRQRQKHTAMYDKMERSCCLYARVWRPVRRARVQLGSCALVAMFFGWDDGVGANTCTWILCVL